MRSFWPRRSAIAQHAAGRVQVSGQGFGCSPIACGCGGSRPVLRVLAALRETPLAQRCVQRIVRSSGKVQCFGNRGEGSHAKTQSRKGAARCPGRCAQSARRQARRAADFGGDSAALRICAHLHPSVVEFLFSTPIRVRWPMPWRCVQPVFTMRSEVGLSGTIHDRFASGGASEGRHQ